MITFALASLAIVQAPVVLEPKIVSAIVMKNGMVMLVREADLPAGAGTYRIEKIPTAYDGAFWYGANTSRVSDLKTSLAYTKKKLSRGVANLAELLKANVGKSVQLKVGTQDGEVAQNGTIEDATPSTLTLRNDDNLRFIHLNSIVEINVSTLTNKEVSAEVDWPELAITFTSESSARDKFRILTLESGAAWAGSYLVDLGKDRAEVNGKAVLGLGKHAFENVDVKLLAGSPHMMLSRRYDLATGIGSVFDYLGNRQSLYRELNGNPLDPYERLGEVIRTAANALAVAQTGWMGGGIGGGGFGGNGFVPQGVEPIQYDPTDNSLIVRGGEFQAQGGGTTAANANEDVFLYNLGRVSLLPGERLTRPLFNVTSAYELINVWTDIGVPSIKKQLRLKNDSSLPFTPGSCLVMRNGEFLAMTEMPHAAPTQTVDVPLGTVIDLKVETETQMIDSRVVRAGNSMFTVFKHRKTIILENPRDEAVTFEIRTEVNGKILDAGGAKVTVVDKYFNRTEYVRKLLVWKVTVPARSVKELRTEFESRN